MPLSLPEEVETCIKLGALRLGRSLEFLEWPSADADAPPPEANAVFHVGFYLSDLPKPFHLYAEGAVLPHGRMDLMGSNGETAIALEAKRLSNIDGGSSGALNDLKRMQDGFSPALATPAGNRELNQWWHTATARWGIILITSFRGVDIRNAWLAQSEALCRQQLAAYPMNSTKPSTGADEFRRNFVELHENFFNGCRGAAFITEGTRWPNTGEGWLLWGAVPLASSFHPVKSA